MTRGRKKDLTIPPTRSLVQQRDYRARKANYIASLEERCRKAEEENAQLRQELMQTRARLENPATMLPETAEASKELMRHLALASASMEKFQRIAFNNVVETAEPTSPTLTLPPIHMQLSAHISPDRPQQQSEVRPSNTFGKKHFYVDNTPPFSPDLQRPSTNLHHRSQSSDSEECCGGMIDCEALGHDGVIEQDADEYSRTRQRLSGLRSTSNHDHR
ncbi:hypothetical protein D9613_000543 [Agrocybe pediades]|uniref:BZIP domain-containing protein n=1 Tax=Agrocybe pediades TaxID=84607 RepID=A0A8H4R2Q0_9AGAR|nr:hypothetical protein D9613_000543 [Agrocybe pediades]